MPMNPSSLTPQEFEQHVEELRTHLREYLEQDVGKYRQLRAEAEQVLRLAPDFPEVYEKFPDVEGLVAEMLAREKQKDFMASQEPDQEAPGCLLGWLARGGK